MVTLEAPRDLRGMRGVRGTTPARLLLVGVVVTLGCVLAAATSVGSALDRTGAVDAAGGPVAALTDDAATIYGELADADAAATSGFVSPGVEPPAVRAAYDAAVDRAAAALVDATARLTDVDGGLGRGEVATLARGVPVYTGLVENARALNRLGLPLGQTYLAQASTRMREELLPAASALRTRAGATRAAAIARGGAAPWSVLVLGLGTLVALAVVSRSEARRTHRRRNRGLAVGAGLVVVAMLWWVLVTVVAGTALGHADDRAQATDALDDARTATLQARSNESLVLAARTGGDDRTFTELLARGERDVLAADPHDGDTSFRAVSTAAARWGEAHRLVRGADDDGHYTDAVRSVVGAGPDGSDARFRELADGLRAVSSAARNEVASSVTAARAVQTLVVTGPGLALALAAVAVGSGMWRRIEEYR